MEREDWRSGCQYTLIIYVSYKGNGSVSRDRTGWQGLSFRMHLEGTWDVGRNL